MSSGLSQLAEKVASNPEMQAELKGTTDRDAFVQKVVDLGKQHGHDVSHDDVNAELNKHVEGDALSDAQLDSIAGGGLSDCAFWLSPTC